MDSHLLAALVLTTVLAAPTLTGCHSDAKNDSAAPTSESEVPHHRTTRQFIPDLDIYVTMPQDWVAFADGVHDNKGMVTYQMRPKWETPDSAQYVRIRKLQPTPDLPEVAKWLGESNADAVSDFVKARKVKVTADKRDSWESPGLPGASASIELESAAPPAGAPNPDSTAKLYVAFIGTGDQRWQVATTNSPDNSPPLPGQFLGPEADSIARAIQHLNK